MILLGVYMVFITSVKGQEEPECTNSTFGWNCRFSCACAEGQCDPVTGNCISGCIEGKYGTNCQLNSTCMYDHRGFTYAGSVNTTGNGSDCMRWSDLAVEAGYSAESFPDGDFEHNSCRNPRRGDHYAVKPWCYVSTPLGVSYEYCDHIPFCECPSGLYGPGCTETCRCLDPEEVCHPLTGTCSSGCAVGWTGLDCQKRCPLGYYGMNCMSRCMNCFNSSCDPETGSCTDGCDLGFRGDNCTEKCPKGHYGRGCAGQCGNCSEGEPCHVITGHCFAGCAPGYVGDMCTQWCRETDTYKRVCVKQCGSCTNGTKCDLTTGQCVFAPEAIVTEKVIEKPSRTLMIVAICSACVVAALITAVACLVRNKMRKFALREQEKEVLQEYYLDNYKRMESLDVPETQCEQQGQQREQQQEQEQQQVRVVQDVKKDYCLVVVRNASETSV